MKFLKSLVILIALASPSFAAEDPIVSDGLSIPTYLEAVDGTNILYSEAVTGAFTTVNTSPTVTVKHAASVPNMSVSIGVGTKVSFTGTSATVGGLTMDGAWTIASIVDSTHFTFTHSSNATSTVSTPTANTTIAYTSSLDDGKLRFICRFSHLAYDDPVVNPGVPGAAHLHLFFGNTLTNANSTYNSLRVSGDGTCDGGPLNRTAYWMPAMIDSSVNKVRIPEYFEWYYADARSDLVDFASPVCGGAGLLQDGRAAACPNMQAIKKIERGMKAVFGFKPSAGRFPDTYYRSDLTTFAGPLGNVDPFATSWVCHDTSGNIVPGVATGYRYLSHRSNPSLGVTGDANCPSSGQISFRAGNPYCWDGTHDSTDHYIHFAYPSQDGSGNLVCPTTHPKLFQQFTVIAVWNYTGGISSVNSWYLSSDRHNGANFEAGESFHWDMMWAWNDSVQQFFHENIQGMSPSSSTGAPYLYNSAGANWAGGPYMRNTNNGGLGSDCTALGMAGACRLKQHSSGISDVLLDIPPLRRRGAGKSK
jgi:hypothetical protein